MRRPISVLCPVAKVLESLILPTINKYLQHAPDQHGFRPDHSTTSALLQMTTDITMGFNQRKPPDRKICIAVDLSAAVCHNNLRSKINRSQLILPQRDGYHINAAFCMFCSLLMLVKDARGNHMKEAYSRTSIITGL